MNLKLKKEVSHKEKEIVGGYKYVSEWIFTLNHFSNDSSEYQLRWEKSMIKNKREQI